MYLLYLDGSGSVKNPKERHFILAGVVVFERQIFHLIRKTDDFISALNIGDPHDVELHGSVMANGKTAPWKKRAAPSTVWCTAKILRMTATAPLACPEQIEQPSTRHRDHCRRHHAAVIMAPSIQTRVFLTAQKQLAHFWISQ